MTAFRILLVLLFINMVVFTIVAGTNEGWDLASVFINDLKAMNWSGQFNVDFTSYLILSAVWLAWRYEFKPRGLAIAVVALVMGILVFAPLLLYLTIKAKGDVKEVLLGEGRSK